MRDLPEAADWFAMLGELAPVPFWCLFALLAALALSGFLLGFRALSRARLIEDSPTARVRSAPQGLVELQGRGEAMGGLPIRSPLTGEPCLWWDYRIERHAGGRGSRWTRVAGGRSDGLFFLSDATGRCVVNPEGARVLGALERRWYGDSPSPLGGPDTGLLLGRYRYTERLLLPGRPLYALGWFETRSGHYSPASLNLDTARLLREWKRDRHWLLGRFDHNRDGTLDLDEWAFARREARRLAEAAAARHAIAPDVHVLMRPPTGRPFLLSTVPPARLTRRLRRRAALQLGLFLASGAAAVAALGARLAGTG